MIKMDHSTGTTAFYSRRERQMNREVSLCLVALLWLLCFDSFSEGSHEESKNCIRS